jgi:acetyl-CoA synthetase
MSKEFKVMLYNKSSELSKLVQLIENFSNFYKINSDIKYNLNLFLEELFITIISYNYMDSDKHLLYIDLDYKENKVIQIKVDYAGYEFNPFDIEYKAPKSISLDTIETISIRIHLIKILIDSYYYEFENNQNKLTLKIFNIPNKKTLNLTLEEKRHFQPPKNFVKNATIKSLEEYKEIYKKSIEKPEKFWAEKAKDLEWFKTWDEVLKENFAEGEHEWFSGGKLNVCYNCLDKNVKNGKKDKTALIWEGNKPGEEKKLTYQELLNEVCKFANVLKKHGVKKGDRVTIYLPMITELSIAMLACARIGAVHNIVFGGFSSESLRDRIIDSESSVLICADGYFRGDKSVDSKKVADEAIKGLKDIKKVFVVQRVYNKVTMEKDRDYFWETEMGKFDIENFCEPEVMDSEDPLFILYTSGSTGKPKGVLHTQAGYLLYTKETFKYIFDIKDEDIYWCTADIGWITGHSYIIYGPLANGATTVIFEGIPSYPDYGRFWDIVEKYKINIFYTAPTALRALMKQGDNWINNHDLSSLRLIGTVGEPINPEVWIWYYEVVGKKKCPIIDTWWQTETGGVLISTLPGAMPTKPGSAGMPFFGIEPKVIKENMEPTSLNEGGWLVITKPWPGLMRRVYGNPTRFKDTYFSQFYGVYTTGDSARIDEEGYYWLMGRTDDVINVSGHRFGTAEIESAIVSHPGVAEAAVVGYPHEIKGQGIYAFVILKNNIEKTEKLVNDLKTHVRNKIGPIATPDIIQLTDGLPKTRSGKIMRRILTRIAAGEKDNLGDTTTLLDPNIVDVLIKGRISL